MTDLDPDEKESFVTNWIRYIGLGNLGNGSQMRVEALDDLDGLSRIAWWKKWKEDIPQHLHKEARNALIDLDA